MDVLPEIRFLQSDCYHAFCGDLVYRNHLFCYNLKIRNRQRTWTVNE